MTKKMMMFFAVLFFAYQINAHAAEISPIRMPDDAIAEYTHPEKNVTVKQKVASDETDGAFELWQMTAGEIVELPFVEHHLTYKTIFVMGGALDMKIGADTFEDMGKGYTIHILPFTPHSMTLKPGTDLLVLYAGEGIRINPFRGALFKSSFSVIEDLHDPVEPFDPSAKALNEIRDLDFSVEYYPDTEDSPGVYEVKRKIAGYETGGYFEVAHMNLIPPPTEGNPTDCHKHLKAFETWIILDGEVEMACAVGDELVTCGAGSVIHAAPNVVHCGVAKKPAEILMIHPALYYHRTHYDSKPRDRYHPGLNKDPDFYKWWSDRGDYIRVE